MNMIRKSTTLLAALPLTAFLLLFFSCNPDKDPPIKEFQPVPTKQYSNEVPLRWYTLFQEIDRYSPGYRPPAAARMLAYVGLAGYEAAVNGMPEYNSMAGAFQGLEVPAIEEGADYHWPTAVNAAYNQMFLNFYPHVEKEYLNKINTLNQYFEDKYSSTMDADRYERSKAFGEAVAQAVYDWSKTDEAGHEAYKTPRPTSYNPPATGSNGEKLWQPTYPDYSRALFPYWGQVRTFAMQPTDIVSQPPIAWSEDPNSQFYAQANEIRLWVDNATDEDKWIAEFWSDDIFELTFEPAARLIAIANQLNKADGLKMDVAVTLYAQMGMALSDVGVAVWNSKYIYNVERPVQYIRRVMDPNWKTILNNPINNVQGMTPEFPAYPSGHSGFGGAGASILDHFFGSRSFTDYCHDGRTEFVSTPRTFTSFTQLGEEDAYSRLPLGVHYRMDCDEGLRLGYLSALRVIDLPWRK